jgi:hypothetical protein
MIEKNTCCLNDLKPFLILIKIIFRNKINIYFKYIFIKNARIIVKKRKPSCLFLIRI